MVRRGSKLAVCMLVAGCLLGGVRGEPALCQAEPERRLVSFPEAKKLVLLVEEVRQALKQGLEIDWHPQLAGDWYLFEAYLDDQTSPAGPLTLGSFAVSRHTGEVWQVSPEKKLSSPELLEAQRTLQAELGLDQRTVALWKSHGPDQAKPHMDLPHFKTPGGIFPEEAEGLVIQEIQFVGLRDEAMDSAVWKIVRLEEERPFHRKLYEETLKNLEASGLFDSVDGWIEPGKYGLVVRFTVKAR